MATSKKKEYSYRCWRCNKTNDYGFCPDCTEKCAHCHYPKNDHKQIFEAYLCPTSLFKAYND